MRIKTFLSFLFAAFVLLSCGPKTKSEEASPDIHSVSSELSSEISFKKKINDLGNIKEGEQVIVWFEYKNTGEGPLLIQNIKAGCGCTVPSWNKNPLEAGENESIKVIFNSQGKNGTQNIRISVNSNASNSLEELRIKGYVESY